MPAVLRMPTRDELPDGPRRDFVAEIFDLYKLAGRPPIRDVGDRIRRNSALAGTASRETLRRVLRGKTVPRRWDTIEAIALCLCEMAELDPQSLRWDDGWDNPPRLQFVRDRWNDALDDPSTSPAVDDDPWASVPTSITQTSDNGGFSDEPPF